MLCPSLVCGFCSLAFFMSCLLVEQHFVVAELRVVDTAASCVR